MANVLIKDNGNTQPIGKTAYVKKQTIPEES